MRNLFRSGLIFFILAGISFLLIALKYLLSDDRSKVSMGALVVTGVIWFVVGIAIRRKNAN